jgi:hypothetical protein
VDTADFTAGATFRIDGTIANAPDGILVVLTNGVPGVVQQTVTYGGTGKFSFFNIPAGDYTIDPQPTSGTVNPNTAPVTVDGNELISAGTFTYAP